VKIRFWQFLGFFDGWSVFFQYQAGILLVIGIALFMFNYVS
jgi:hypothetical protein